MKISNITFEEGPISVVLSAERASNGYTLLTVSVRGAEKRANKTYNVSQTDPAASCWDIANEVLIQVHGTRKKNQAVANMTNSDIVDFAQDIQRLV